METLPFTNVGLRNIWGFALKEAEKGPLPAAQLEAIFDAYDPDRVHPSARTSTLAGQGIAEMIRDLH